MIITGSSRTRRARGPQRPAARATAQATPRTTARRAARAAHAAVALVCLAGLVTSVQLGWTTDTDLPPQVGYSGGFEAGWEHTLNQPAYFTVLSALVAGATSLLLAVRPERDGRLFRTMRLSGVVCVLITGAVFNLLLRGDGELSGVDRLNDTLLHVILPVLAPLVWLFAGPRGTLSGRIVLGSLVVPLGWLAVTLARGPAIDWYPYDILDVPGMGWSGVGVHIGSILAGYLLLDCLLWGVDRVLVRVLHRQRG